MNDLNNHTGLSIARLSEQYQNNLLLVITPDIQTADRLRREIRFFNAHQSISCYYFPDWETLPYDHFSPHPDLISERLSVLHHLLQGKPGIILTALPTAMHRLLPQDHLLMHSLSLDNGDTLDLQTFREQLDRAGYHAVNQVFEHGEFSIRGAILDLFPMGSPCPYRIELFDNQIDSIRRFDPNTQCSIDKVTHIRLLPAREYPLTEEAISQFRQNWRAQFPGNPKESNVYGSISEGLCASGAEYYLPLFFSQLQTLFDYLPEKAKIVCSHPLPELADKFWQDIQHRYEQLKHDTHRPICEPTTLFTPPNEFFSGIKKGEKIQLYPEVNPLPDLFVEHQSHQPLHRLDEWIKNNSERLLFCAETAGRREILLELLSDIKIRPTLFRTWHDFLESDDRFGICVAPLDQGLSLKDPALLLISESQLFGEQIQQRRLRKKQAQDPESMIRNLTELTIGSPVVHMEHGVARYLGMEQIQTGDQSDEYLKLEYAGGDKIYVPVTSLHLISRYTGLDAEHAPLQKLGSQKWQTIKRKTIEQIRDVAAELLDIYSRRQAIPGYAFKAPDAHFLQFRRSFPFEETADQSQAIDAVIADMTKPHCMDRLVCGDVGFGKTEVAMQAAFLAVQNGKQVAVLVPTTLLAEQHLRSFQDRFADWPVQVTAFSRMQKPKDQALAVEQLKAGKIDIAIGTHKLLSADICFKDLGLLVIDEEHRFGVRQKDRIKALRTHVDILALTATPIPRTLNMAFVGIRDLSIIATPPARRLSVKTFVHEFQHQIIREAILREIMRGGQLYFLHNEVNTIVATLEKLQTIVPEARMAIAHGQMPERQLEKVMGDFYHQRFNVLVCTTIIESGIDIPTANTILINRANHFGLAQLHQLRGRVGRSHHQAYAYLLTPAGQKLNRDAEKRLQAISELEDLGAGFQLATHDLEIRGAGELLGEEQSGQMHAIGFSLYTELLEEAVRALKAGEEPSLEKPSQQGPEINLHMSALIPESYVFDIGARLTLYKRLSNCGDKKEIQTIKAEMIDRFGPIPNPTQQLFDITHLKLKITPLGIIKIDIIGDYGYFHFSEKPNIDPKKMIALIQQQPKIYQLQGPKTLRFKLTEKEPKKRMTLMNEVIETIINKT